MLFEFIWKVAAVVALTYVSIALFRIAVELLFEGSMPLRSMREHGGGFFAFFRGRLGNGHGSARPEQAHGLHMKIDASGNLVFEQKSKII